jgi:hypothetical protein
LFYITSFSQTSNPTKKETFDFIIYECSNLFYGDDIFSVGTKHHFEITSYDSENLTIKTTDTYENWVINSKLDFNDISSVSWSNPEVKTFGSVPFKDGHSTTEIFVYFKIPYKCDQYMPKFDYTVYGKTQDYITLPFTSISKAKKTYKALLHLQSLVGVKTDLFDDK